MTKLFITISVSLDRSDEVGLSAGVSFPIVAPWNELVKTVLSSGGICKQSEAEKEETIKSK